MSIKRKILMVVVLLVSPEVSADATNAPVVADSSFSLPDGSRVLQQSIEVPASPHDVWHAFTTAEGLTSWAVPFAVVDFRLGGTWETSYQPHANPGDPANIRSRIISFLPMSMLSIQAEKAPPGFPNPELLQEMFSVFQFEPLDNDRVRITVSGIGYGEGTDFDALYDDFSKANHWTLLRLHERFTNGPVQWDQAYPTIKNKE